MRPGWLRIAVAALAAGLCLAQAAWAGPPEARRLEIPIKAVRLADGDMRFTVTVSIGGGVPFEAMIDSGSKGLRLTPSLAMRQADRYTKSGRVVSTRFASGLITRGEVSTAEVSVGGAAPATVTIQAIDGLSCMAERPRCGIGGPPEDFRIGGVSPTDGFEAVLGIGLRLNSFGNPLSGTASGRWIVILPRPGEPGPGKLILNPDEADMAGFTLFQLAPASAPGGGNTGWLDEELTACLISELSARQWCGDAVLDTGAPNVYLHTDEEPPPWRRDESMRVELGQGERRLTFRYRMQQGPGAALYRLRRAGGETEKVNLGILPYYYYAVYYDGRGGVIGLKARPPMAVVSTAPAPASPSSNAPLGPKVFAPPATVPPPLPIPPVPAPRSAHPIDGCTSRVQPVGNHCPTGGN